MMNLEDKANTIQVIPGHDVFYNFILLARLWTDNGSPYYQQQLLAC
jgi:hypothetical protein